MAVADLQGDPCGLLVVTLIVTTLPASLLSGVYVKENGDEETEDGVTDPLPLSVIITAVAFPPNVLLFTVTGVRKQVEPLVWLRFTMGGLLHRF